MISVLDHRNIFSQEWEFISNPVFQNRGFSWNQTMQAKQCDIELKDSQPALVSPKNVVFTTEGFRCRMSLGLRLLLMTRFGRPLPTTPDICIGVPSPAPAHAGHPHQPLRAGTGCCRYLWIWAVQNETGLQIYFLLSYRYPCIAAWRSSWRWWCLRVGAVTAATSRTSGADPAVLTRLTWERISLPYQSVPRNLTRPWGTDHRACTLYTLLRGNGTLGLIKLISEGIQISFQLLLICLLQLYVA